MTPASPAAAGRWPLRAIRSLVFAAASVGLAVGAHRLAGGMIPSPGIAVLGGVVLLALGLAISGRELRGAQLTGLVLGTQFALHAAFMLTCGAMSGSDQTELWARLIFCHSGTTQVTPAQVAAARAAIDMSGMQMAPAAAPGLFSASALGMVATHLVAAGAMAWWLRQGERAVWSAAAQIARLGSPITAPGSLPIWRRPGRAAGSIWIPALSTCLSGAPRRGPPMPARLDLHLA